MQRYTNRSGKSGVVAYELRPQAIIVEFRDGWKYEYSARSVGRAALGTMKRQAVDGRGLSTFISQHVRNAYSRKFLDR
jgi:hypothetical protein